MTADYDILELLESNSCRPENETRAQLEELTAADGTDVLRRLASGELDTGSPRLREKAVAALLLLDQERPATLELLRGQLHAAEEGEEGIDGLARRLAALQGLARLNASGIHGEARNLVRDPSTPPPLALAAAELVAEAGGEDVQAELGELRRRFLSLVEDEESPSVQALDTLIAGGSSVLDPAVS